MTRRPETTETTTEQHATPSRPVVVLFGFMGAGKTAVGRCVAERLGVGFTDADHAIEAEQGRPIREIFAEDGEAVFRELENRTVVRLLHEPVGVLALGGGAAMHPATREALRAHPLTVHLAVGLATARARCGDDPTRPMLRRPDLADLHRERMRVYADLATHEIATDDLDSDQVCAQVLALITP